MLVPIGPSVKPKPRRPLPNPSVAGNALLLGGKSQEPTLLRNLAMLELFLENISAGIILTGRARGDGQEQITESIHPFK
jgi:hypothetical protein